jgi:hypothetical protein
MAATKTAKTLYGAAQLAGAANVNASEWNLSTAYGGLATVKITNGATAPTAAPVVKFYVGEATGVKRLLYQVTGDTVNSSVTDLVCEVPASAMFVNINMANLGGNAITVEAYGQELTTI